MKSNQPASMFIDILNDDCFAVISDHLDFYSTFAFYLTNTRINHALKRIAKNPYIYTPELYAAVAIEAVRNNDLETIQALNGELYFKMRIATSLGHIYAVAVDLEQTVIVEYLKKLVKAGRRYYYYCNHGCLKLKNEKDIRGPLYLDLGS